MRRSAQPSQFSTYPIQNIDIPNLSVLENVINTVNESFLGQLKLKSAGPSDF